MSLLFCSTIRYIHFNCGLQTMSVLLLPQIGQSVNLISTIIVITLYMTHFFVLVHADTTDVQNVRLIMLDDQHLLRVECAFIPGSDSQGCLVILVGEYKNTTVNITSHNYFDMNVNYLLSCFKEVLAFDIERDGTVGTVAVRGKVNKTSDHAVVQNCFQSPDHDITMIIEPPITSS